MSLLLLVVIGIAQIGIRGDVRATSPRRADVAQHDIILQQEPTTGRVQLFNRVTRLPFVPRGNAYEHLTATTPSASAILRPGTLGARRASTFDPGDYDSTLIETAFSQMQALGYNSVRLLLPGYNAGNPNGPGLSATYLANVTDALNRAQRHNLRPILSLTSMASSGGCGVQSGSGYYPTPDPGYLAYDANWLFLTQQALDAERCYLTDLLTGLANHGAPLSYVFAYDLTGEVGFLNNSYPLSVHSGTLTTKSGTFALSVDSDRARMLDINLVDYLDGLTDAIHAVDPGALTSAQLLPNAENHDPAGVTLPDEWPLLTPDVTDRQGRHGSKVDFITLSLYPTFDQSVGTLMNSLGVAPTMIKKALITSEMGWLDSYLTGRPQYTINDLPPRTLQWEKDSCDYGVYGWFFYTWDTPHSATPYYNAVENGMLFANALAPNTVPDICGLLTPKPIVPARAAPTIPTPPLVAPPARTSTPPAGGVPNPLPLAR